jgi:hypothetical protein
VLKATDVDQNAWIDETELHEWDKALSSGKKLSFFSVARQQL